MMYMGKVVSIVEKGIKSVLSCLILALLCAVFFSCTEKVEEPAFHVYENLKEVDRLELARMTVGKVGMVSDTEWEDADSWGKKAEALLNKVKIGKRIGVYSYDTYVTAYIDLSQLRPEDVKVDREKGTVDIRLPRVKVMIDGREPQLHEEHYRVTGMRSSIKPDERAKLKAQMAKEVKRELAASGEALDILRRDGESKAREWIRALVSNWDLDANVEFR